MSSPENRSKPLRGSESGQTPAQPLTQPGPNAAQASRPTADPIKRNPETMLGRAFESAEPGRGRSAGKFIRRSAPRSDRRRELTAVLALVVAAGVISASLPGRWTGTPDDVSAGRARG